ncbi:unnamed protein product [Schistosoma turkestanicum]|nr:unnamed protein product [Schistosoma turkestanicum]
MAYYLDTDKDESNYIPHGVDISGDYNQEVNATGNSLDQVEAQWMAELKQVEDEIQTLRQVLLSKFRRQQFLKRQLGLTPIEELKTEVKQGLDTLLTSDAYLKTTAVVKTAKDKTSAALFEKWNLLRQTNTYKSLENKVGTAYSNVYGKLTRSKTLSSGHENIGNFQGTTATTTTTTANTTTTPITSKSYNVGMNDHNDTAVPQSIPVISSSSSSSFNRNNQTGHDYHENNVELGEDENDTAQLDDNLLNDDMVLLSNRIDNEK